MPRRVSKVMRIGHRRVRAPTGDRNRKKYTLISIILDPAIKPGSAPDHKYLLIEEEK